jgi:hypothetical protein
MLPRLLVVLNTTPDSSRPPEQRVILDELRPPSEWRRGAIRRES